MEILLKNMELFNFKGIRKLKIDFSHITDIFGDNATGKTTTADSFMWLLFDKDSQDRTVGDKEANFQIKTYDENGDVLHGLEHGVRATLEVDGHPLDLCKIYKEKWTKERGAAEKTLSGNETNYYINEVPVKKSEYQAKINSLMNESIFKLITNPLYFSTNVKWQDRRKTLMDILGDIAADRVMNYKPSLKALEGLLGDNDIDAFKKSIQARKSKMNADLKAIPFRIDECNNSIVENDFDALEFKKNTLVPAIRSLEEQLINKTKVSDVVLEKKNELNKLKEKIFDLEHNAQIEAKKPLMKFKEQQRELEENIREKEQKVRHIESQIASRAREIENIKMSIAREEKIKDDLTTNWHDANSKKFEFDEKLCTCPTCKRPYETENIEATKAKMLENFNMSKAAALQEINKKGKERKKNIEDLNKKIDDLSSSVAQNPEPLKLEIKKLKTDLDNITSKIREFNPTVDLTTNEEYKETLSKIEELENSLKAPVDNVTEELKSKKRNLELELEDLNKQLTYKEHNANMKARIKQLMDEEKKISEKIAELEGQEFLCEEFIKTKVELLESSINSKFKYVSFKLFETQVNGGINECCEALIEGVPFSNANTASQINAGLDIINTLCDHYGVRAPIFIDNREAINKIIETDSQVINLIVSKDKALRIEGEM